VEHARTSADYNTISDADTGPNKAFCGYPALFPDRHGHTQQWEVASFEIMGARTNVGKLADDRVLTDRDRPKAVEIHPVPDLGSIGDRNVPGHLDANGAS